MTESVLDLQPVTQPVGSSFEERLQLTHGTVEQVLACMPGNLLEARRLITRELAFEPSPEELQAIVRVAGEAEGARRELPRRLLVLRILAGCELQEFSGSWPLDPDTIERSAVLLPRLIQATAQAEQAVASALDAADDAARTFLEPVIRALQSPREDLVAAQVLAPRLVQLTRAAQDRCIESAAPSLSAEEAALFYSAVGEPVGAAQPSRAVLDALALRSVMQDDLAARKKGADAAVMERLERDKIAFHVVSTRIQKQHDTALAAGLDEFVAGIRRTQKSLFSTYLRLSRVLSGSEQLEMEQVRQKMDEAEAAGEQHRTEAAVKDELCNKALTDLKQPARKPEVDPGLAEHRRENRRVRILSVATAVLAVAVAVVYLLLPGPSSEPPAILMQELSSSAVRVEKLTPTGPLMFAEISSASWAHMADDERRRHLSEMGQTAAGRGYQLLHLVDQQARHVATWSKLTGVDLAQTD